MCFLEITKHWISQKYLYANILHIHLRFDKFKIWIIYLQNLQPKNFNRKLKKIGWGSTSKARQINFISAEKKIA